MLFTLCAKLHAITPPLGHVTEGRKRIFDTIHDTCILSNNDKYLYALLIVLPAFLPVAWPFSIARTPFTSRCVTPSENWRESSNIEVGTWGHPSVFQ
jgi:hypothetical protein